MRSEQSGGALSVTDNTLPAGWDGPPLHHHEFDEAFYVLEGELRFQVGDDLLTAGPGELAFAPGGTPHTVANPSDAPAAKQQSISQVRISGNYTESVPRRRT